MTYWALRVGRLAVAIAWETQSKQAAQWEAQRQLHQNWPYSPLCLQHEQLAEDDIFC